MRAKEKKKKGNIVFILLIILLIGVFAFSAFLIGQWLFENYQTSQLSNELQDIVGSNDVVIEEDNVQVNPPVKEEDSSYTMDLTELINRNPDTVAWIRMTGTNVNYPVVQTTNNSYYLKRNFDKKWTNAGWIFGDYRNDFTDIQSNKNVIIYGHGRRDMSMFGSLEYCRRSWWLNNPDYHTIHIITPTEETVWQVFAVYPSEKTFYYIQTRFSGNEFMELVGKMKQRSIKNFGVDVTPEDTILTLSTCTTDADRLVVNAALVSTKTRFPSIKIEES